jgi:unsaturated rhamnogalacturonyl hydrolase
MHTILHILLVLFVCAVAVDVYLRFYTWQSRIHIGRFPDRQTWAKAILTKAEKWLHKTPVIKLTDNKRLVVIDMLRGNYKRKAIQHWQEAALVLGLEQAYNVTKSAEIKRELGKYIASKIGASGNWKQMPSEIDGVILAYAILKTEWIDHSKNRPAYDAVWNLLKDFTGPDGTVCYRKHMKDYRYVDTIGFICPFLVLYGVKFNVPEAVDLGCRQILEFNSKGMYPQQFIPCHTYDTRSGIPVGLFGWGRGLGWYAIGLIDAWNELPESHPKKAALTESVVAFAKMAAGFQNANGSWNWLITDTNTNADSSATATLAWLLANAVEIPEIAALCHASAEKALSYLMKVTRRDGAIDLSQGDTKGIGVHSHDFDILPFTQGFAVRTAYRQNSPE